MFTSEGCDTVDAGEEIEILIAPAAIESVLFWLRSHLIMINLGDMVELFDHSLSQAPHPG